MLNESYEDDGAGSGAASLAGYEYQADVSVWLALDLVLANRWTEELVLEPASQEDLEADLGEFVPGPMATGAKLDSYRLIVQAKLRNGDAWTAKGIERLLQHGEDRVSAAERLKDPAARYLLVTSAAINGAARKLGVRRAGTWPREMPPSIAKALPAGAAGRVAVVANQDPERLQWEIQRLLTESFRVPFAHREACHRRLRDEARSRMTRAGGARWTRQELEQLIRQFEGYFASAPELEHYVHPTNWQDLRTLMRERHAALIIGQSGTGKSLATKKLYEELRQEIPGLSRVSIPADASGPQRIRDDRTQPPVLYDIEDPWGKIAFIPERRIWNAQLADFFSGSRPDRLFVATSRADVAESAEDALEMARRWRFVLETEHYGPEERRRLFRTRIASLPPRLHPLARASEEQVLEDLATPLEIQKFFDALLTMEADRAEISIGSAIARAHRNALERTVVDQIGEREDVHAATVLWCLLKTDDRLDRKFLRELEELLAEAKPEFEKGVSPLVDFFVAARNLRQVDSVVSYYHPRVEAGIEKAMLRKELVAKKTIRVVIDSLVKLGETGSPRHIESAARLVAAIAGHENLCTAASAAAQNQIDAWLAAELGGPRPAYDEALRLAAMVGSPRSNVSEVARFLLHRPQRDFHGLFDWGVPAHDETWYERMRPDPLTRVVMENFVTDVLPSDVSVVYTGFADAVERLSDGLTPAFLKAAGAVVDYGVISNSDAIAEGAVKDLVGFEAIVDMAVSILTPTEAQRQSEAELHLEIVNGEYSEDYEEYLASNDDGFTADQFLMTYVNRVRETVGWEQLVRHRHHGKLRRYWLRALEKCATRDPAEVAAAVDAAYDTADEDLVWDLLYSAWNNDFAAVLRRRLVHGIADDRAGGNALACAIVHLRDELPFIFDELEAAANTVRLVGLAVDLADLEGKTYLAADKDFTGLVDEAALLLPEPYRDVFRIARALATRARPTVSETARTLIDGLRTQNQRLRVFRLQVDEHAWLAVEDDVRWLLANADSDDAALEAVEAAIRHDMPEVATALRHRFAHVAARALESIAAPLPAPLPEDLLALARAKASPVRRALVRILSDKPHRAHLPSLLFLTEDKWTSASAYDEDNEEYPIARIAVSAISKLDQLDTDTSKMLLIIGVNSRDPVLRKEIFNLLARTAGTGMHERLLALAVKPGREKIALAAAKALIASAEQIAPSVVTAVSAHAVEARSQPVALLLLALLADRGALDQVLAVAESLAKNERRRVFLLFLIWLLLDRDCASANRIGEMFPTNHPAAAWALAGGGEEIDEHILDDLGDQPSIDSVKRLMSARTRAAA
jgi:hypothetical protein